MSTELMSITYLQFKQDDTTQLIIFKSDSDGDCATAASNVRRGAEAQPVSRRHDFAKNGIDL